MKTNLPTLSILLCTVLSLGFTKVKAQQCSPPTTLVNSVTRCGSGNVQATVVSYNGCSLEWYLASTGTTGTPISTDSTVSINIMRNDTLMVRSVCPQVCSSAFSMVMVTVDTSNFSLSLQPGTARVGETVTMMGLQLNRLASLTLNGQPLAYNMVSSTQATFAVPANAQSGWVVGMDSAGTFCPDSVFFTLNTAPIGCPDITLTPSSAANGMEVSVTGANMASVYELRLGGMPVPFRRESATELVFTVPAGATSGVVQPMLMDTTQCMNPASLTVTGMPAVMAMTSGTANICSARLTDPQGATGTYAPNQYITQTLRPSTPTAQLMLDFTMLDLSDNDQLYVYNGPTTGSPLLFRSIGGTTAPGKLVSTHGSGAITIRFYSNSTGAGTGFEAIATCLTTTDDLPIVTSVSTMTGTNGQTVTIMGMNLDGATAVRFGSMPAASFTVVNSATIRAVVPFGVSSSYISVETPDGVAPAPAMFTVTSDVWHFGGTTTTCSGMLTDAQGPGANYTAGQYQTLTIRPSIPGNNIMLDFSAFDLAAGDQMYVYNGAATTDTLLFRYVAGEANATPPDTLMSTHSSGALTVRFYSDAVGEGAGWMAAISCMPDPTPSIVNARTGTADLMVERFAFWPNPVKGKLNVRLENVEADRLYLLDAQGKIAFQAPVAEGVTEMSLPSLPPGLYHIRCGRHTARLAVE